MREMRRYLGGGTVQEEAGGVKKKEVTRRGRWIVMQTSAKREEVQCGSCPEPGRVIYS